MSKNITEKDLQLLSIEGVPELKTGDYCLKLDFGELLENNAEITSRLSPEYASAGQKQLPTSTVILYLKMENVKPFRVGTNWKLTVAEDENINLRSI